MKRVKYVLEKKECLLKFQTDYSNQRSMLGNGQPQSTENLKTQELWESVEQKLTTVINY